MVPPRNWSLGWKYQKDRLSQTDDEFFLDGIDNTM